MSADLAAPARVSSWICLLGVSHTELQRATCATLAFGVAQMLTAAEKLAKLDAAAA